MACELLRGPELADEVADIAENPAKAVDAGRVYRVEVQWQRPRHVRVVTVDLVEHPMVAFNRAKPIVSPYAAAAGPRYPSVLPNRWCLPRIM